MKKRVLTLLLLFIGVYAFAQEYHFGPVVESLDGLNGTVIAYVTIDDIAVESEKVIEIGVFDEKGECRGRDFVETWGGEEYIAMVVVNGEAGSRLTFKYYDHNSEKESTDLNHYSKTFFNYESNIAFGEIEEPETIEFVTSNIYTFVTDGIWKDTECWDKSSLPAENDLVVINANCTVGAAAKALSVTVNEGASLTLNKKLTTGLITVNDGGQFYSSNASYLTSPVCMKKNISKYVGTKDNYYLLAAPFNNGNSYSPEQTGLIPRLGEEQYGFDLYQFDQTQPQEEWRNYKVSSFSLKMGEGYLYANNKGNTVSFIGTPVSGTAEVYGFVYDESANLKGFNLIGNPLTCNAIPEADDDDFVVGYYMINPVGRNEIVAVEDPIISPCSALFIVVNDGVDEDFAYSFSNTDEDVNVRKSSNSHINIEVSNNQNEFTDRAYIKFGDGDNLQKYSINSNATHIYFRQNGNDFAKMYANNLTQLPLFFETREYGQYTINVKLENLTCEYLHLIDNLTGMDVDLLATPSYTFQANSSDYAARFKLVFEGTGVEENTATENFAIVEGNRVIIPAIEHESTLEVIDMTGRTVSSQKVNGSFDQTLNVKAGIYMLRLNGMTQKIVIE